MANQQVVGIVGLGPIGTILGAYLTKSGVKVYVVEQVESRLQQVKEKGFAVRGFIDLQEQPEDCFDSMSQLAEIKDLTAILICTKTWAIKQVMTELVKHNWPLDMRIVAAMNGIGPEDAVGEYVSKERICRCIINFAGRGIFL